MAKRERDALDYFRFDATAYLSSPDVLAMNPAQRGAFVHLLAIQARTKGCALEADDEKLKAMAGLVGATVVAGQVVSWADLAPWPLIRAQFIDDPDRPGHIYNVKLRKEWLSAWEAYKAKKDRNDKYRAKAAPEAPISNDGDDSETSQGGLGDGPPIEVTEEETEKGDKNTTPPPQIAAAGEPPAGDASTGVEDEEEHPKVVRLAALEALKCPRCERPDTLLRERKTATRPDPGWWCAPKRTGCNTNFDLGEPRIVDQLPAHVRQSIKAELLERAAPPPPASESGAPDPEPDAAAAAAWDQITPHLARLLTPQTFATWFRGAACIPVEIVPGRVLRIRVPTDISARWIEKNFRGRVNAARDEAGFTAMSVEFGVFDKPPPAALGERKEPTRVPGGRTQRPADSGRGG